jgi:hypothetical protein
MNWFKENPSLSGLLVLAIVGTVATTYFALDAASQCDDRINQYNSRATSLRALESKTPFPSQKNLDEIQASIESYKKLVKEFRAQLVSMGEALEPITPQQFQDSLREASDSLRETALKSNVGLPEKFFYGFNEFQAQLPSNTEAPNLNREFKVIRKFVDKLVDLRVTKIDSLERDSQQKKISPAKVDRKPPTEEAGSSDSTPITQDTLTISFTAPQDVVIAALDLIPTGKEFVIIRSLQIDNTAPNPPARGGAKNPSGSGVPGTPGAIPAGFSTLRDAQPSIQVILGRELVKATLKIEVPNFPAPAEENPVKPK